MSPTQRSVLSIVLCAAFATLPQGAVPRDDGQAREVARIRRHLSGAEALMMSRDLSTLTPAQRAARAQRIADLRAYRARGVFPHNHLVSDRRSPVFVDEHGTRCAMAYLIERSGDAAMVARIAGTRNLARIRELAGDAALGAWLDRNGMTLAEAARVQPAYDPVPPLDEGTRNGRPEIWTANVVGAGAGVTGVGLNLAIASGQASRNTRGLLGLALGLLGAGAGAMAFTDQGDQVRMMGSIDIGLGMLSMGLGMRQLAATGPPRRAAAQATLAPVAWREQDGTRRVALTMRF